MAQGKDMYLPMAISVDSAFLTVLPVSITGKHQFILLGNQPSASLKTNCDESWTKVKVVRWQMATHHPQVLNIFKTR